MKNSIMMLAFAGIVFLTACEQKGSSHWTEDNPFAKENTLSYHTYDFTKIKNADYEPAIREGMRQQLEEITKIANSKESPTFENTVVEMEKSGALLTRVNGAFNLLTGAYTNDTLQKVEETIAPLMAAHQDAIYLNDKLFKKIDQLYTQSDSSKLDVASKRLLAVYHQNFVMAGANLKESQKKELKKINASLATLSTKFGAQLLAAGTAASVVFDDVKELDGLAPADLAAAAADAKREGKEGKWLISLQNTTQQPVLMVMKNRASRKKIYEASWNRAENDGANDTRKTILSIANLRAQRAQLMGFNSYAEWKLQDQMAKNPETVTRFFAQLVPAAVAKATEELNAIQQVIDAQKGGFKAEAYDWSFYAEQVRKAKFDLDESQIKPYFLLDSVLKNGLFYAANKMYGITFKARTDLPVYQSDVKVFELFEENGTSIGLFYADYFKRPNKKGGAWMGNLVDQSKLLDNKPVIYNVCNFNKPEKGQPALISFDDVTTLFHEFGHALHGFFANQRYPSISGTATARDFVEFPSQFNEHWALEPSVLNNYAKHYQTGARIPAQLLTKIKNAANFNEGYSFTELLAAANLDLQWHQLKADQIPTDVDQFEKQALLNTGFKLSQVPPRYRSSYFQHIWSNGYAAGYYAYIWTKMLDEDAYQWFVAHGGMTRANGQRFRDMILSRGNSEDLAKLYHSFRGQEPSIEPMLKSKGM